MKLSNAKWTCSAFDAAPNHSSKSQPQAELYEYVELISCHILVYIHYIRNGRGRCWYVYIYCETVECDLCVMRKETSQESYVCSVCYHPKVIYVNWLPTRIGYQPTTSDALLSSARLWLAVPRELIAQTRNTLPEWTLFGCALFNIRKERMSYHFMNSIRSNRLNFIWDWFFFNLKRIACLTKI